jgi:hypothetical protein
MKYLAVLVVTGAALILLAQPPAGPVGPSGAGRGPGGRGPAPPFDYSNNDGWEQLFNGKDLTNWDGPPYWSVKDDSIYINTCVNNTGTTYIHYTGPDAGDFELKYEMKALGVNGGMQFRSYMTFADNLPFKYPSRAFGGFGGGRGGSGGRGGFGAFGGSGGRGPGGGGGGRGNACPNGVAPQIAGTAPGPPAPTSALAKWDMSGPQADFDANDNGAGQFYEQNSSRGILVQPGFAALAESGGRALTLATLADKPQRDSWFHFNDYNQFLIVCRGHVTEIFMNGHLIMSLVDNDPDYFVPSGKLGPEVEGAGEYWVKNIYLKRLNAR